jgi:hypothetical protein
MGLDMTLSRNIIQKQQLGYWRDFKPLHNWFVVNVQNNVDDSCRYKVSRKQLKQLLHICKQVLDNPNLANTLLPDNKPLVTDTEYDTYLKKLNTTVTVISDILVDNKNKVFYYLGWW